MGAWNFCVLSAGENGGQKRYHKETLCDKDFAERSGELSGAICLKTLVLLGLVTSNPLELFRKFFGAIRANFTGFVGPFCRVRKISPKFSCIKFFQIRDVPTQIPGHPGHSLSKTTEKGHLHKVFVRDIPTSGSLMSQEYPAQKLYV